MLLLILGFYPGARQPKILKAPAQTQWVHGFCLHLSARSMSLCSHCVLRAGLLQDARLRHRRQADGFAEHLVGFRVSLGFYDGSCKGPVPAVRHVLGHVWGSQCSGVATLWTYGHWRRQQQQQCLQRTVIIIIIMIMGSVSSQASQFASSLPLSSSATLLVIMTTVART